MNKIVLAAGVAALFAGCAFNPESMPVDAAVYVDEGAPKTLDTKEEKAKVAVITSVGDFKDYKQVGEFLDSSLNAKLAGFSFFDMVDRKSQAALIKDAAASGGDPAEMLRGVEADFVVVARIASLVARPWTTRNGTSYSLEVVFDFKWIGKATQRVIMTESFKPTARAANSPADVIVSLNDAAESAVKDFCAKIAVKYAPPARVLETRGNGEAARISIGKNYGVAEHTTVCFYEIVDNSDVGGAKRDMRDIATGKVKRVEEKTAWVQVKNPAETNVRKGVYVRVLGLARGSIKDSLLDLQDTVLGK